MPGQTKQASEGAASMQALVERGQRSLCANYRPAPIVLDRGEGAVVYDLSGARYIDLIAGVAVSSLGHAHPGVVAALEAGVHKVLHTSNMYYNAPAARLADALVSCTFAERVFFCQSGAEANEAALKLARRYHHARGTARPEYVSALDSFHGRTFGALSATGQQKYHQGFEPMLPGFHHVPYGDVEALAPHVGERTAAVILEVVQGEGGVRIPPAGYIGAVRRICDDTGALLILDEVQTGVGRTGHFLACEGEGVTPDIATLAKGLAAGLPLGAMLAREEVAAALVPGTHASTFGGNPLSCAAAEVVVGLTRAPDFLAEVRRLGEVVLAHLERIRARFDFCVEARGKGLLCGLELRGELPGLVDRGRENGVLLNVIGGRVVRVAPPLVITEAELEEGMAGLERALAAALDA